jgi:hypothetical protein
MVSHWHGALERRVRLTPLELFLRSRSLPVITQGASQITDNLTAATVAIVESALHSYCRNNSECLQAPQLEALALIACCISDALSAVIRESQAWRIAALVSSAQVLRGQIDLGSAARLSAQVARGYAAEARNRPALVQIRTRAAVAFESNDGAGISAAVQACASLIAGAAQRHPVAALPYFGAATVT